MASVSSRVAKLEQKIRVDKFKGYSLEELTAAARDYMATHIGRPISDAEYERFKDLISSKKKPIPEITAADLESHHAV